jgi:cyclase
MRDAGDPVELARKYQHDGADELVFLDITASVEKRKILRRVVQAVARVLDIPFTVGGGIRSLADARAVLCSGADKVAVNTAAVQQPRLLRQLANRFGEQCVVLAVDAKRRRGPKAPWFEVFTHGARRATGLDALDWIEHGSELGAGEILLTSIDRDGTERGYDLPLLRAAAARTRVPLIASGGGGHPWHLWQAVTQGGADAALAASIFHYDMYPVPVVKAFLAQHGVPVRQ